MRYTTYMERVTIYLPKQIRPQIKLLAQRVHQPQAVVIRDLLERGLQNTPTDTGDSLLSLANLGLKGGPPDLATNLDDYLYGDKA